MAKGPESAEHSTKSYGVQKHYVSPPIHRLAMWWEQQRNSRKPRLPEW